MICPFIFYVTHSKIMNFALDKKSAKCYTLKTLGVNPTQTEFQINRHVHNQKII